MPLCSFSPPREKFHLNVATYLKKIGLYIQVLLFYTMKLFCFTQNAYDVNHPSHLSISPLLNLDQKKKKKEKNNFSHFSHSDSFMHLGYIQLIQVYFSSQLLAFPSIHSEDIVFPYDTKKNEQYSQMYWSFSLSCVDLIKVQPKMILTFIWKNKHESQENWKK